MLVKVRVFPGSKKEKITKTTDNSFEIKIKEKPERGEANKKLILVLSSYFKIPQSKVRLIKGFRQRNKIFKVDK